MKKKILIVVSEFNKTITDSLLEGTTKTLYNAGFDDDKLDVIWVPGAFEVPLIAKKGSQSDLYQAVICLGCVIKGETPHFDYVCQEAARGIMQGSLDSEKPIIFGILTTDTEAQAMARAGLMSHEQTGTSTHNIKRKVENKGVDAAQAALDMLKILDHWPHTTKKDRRE